MPHALETFINEWLQAWTGNQPVVLAAYYADNALYIDPAKPKGLNGKEELMNYFTKLLAANPDWVWKAKEIIPTEKGCTLKWMAEIPVNKQTISLEGLDIVEINNHLITRNEVFFDRTKWMKAATS